MVQRLGLVKVVRCRLEPKFAEDQWREHTVGQVARDDVRDVHVLNVAVVLDRMQSGNRV